MEHAMQETDRSNQENSNCHDHSHPRRQLLNPTILRNILASYNTLSPLLFYTNPAFAKSLENCAATSEHDVRKNKSNKVENYDYYNHSVCLSVPSVSDDDFENNNGCIKSFISTPHFVRQVLNWAVTYPLVIFVLWTISYIFWTESALPNGHVFSLCVLEVFSICLGEIAGILGLPPLIGMLCAGLFLRNVPFLDIGVNLDFVTSSPFRRMSIVVLLSRGALTVNPTVIKQFIKVIPLLSLGCCILEAIAASLCVRLITSMPMDWSFVQGCMFSSMSQALVTPYLNKTEKNSGAQDKSLFLIAKNACGLDAIVGICFTCIALGFAFTEKLNDGLMDGLVEVAMGGGLGVFWGLCAGILFDNTHRTELRTLVLFCGGVMSFLGMPKIGNPRGGPLGTWAGVLVTATIWRFRKVGGDNNDAVQARFTDLWYFFQPLLFGIMGCRVDVTTIQWAYVGKVLLCLLFGLMVRCVTAFSVSTCTSLTVRQKIFLASAWIPKATVQAALGPVALELCAEWGIVGPMRDTAYQIMVAAVAAIFVCSLFGPWILLLTAKFTLSKANEHQPTLVVTVA